MADYGFSIVVAVICVIAMVIFGIFIKRNQHYKVGGTMHIDMSRPDKDICLFTLHLPLEEIEKEKYVLMKIDSGSNLKEWEK